jgi:hypothetical protein
VAAHTVRDNIQIRKRTDGNIAGKNIILIHIPLSTGIRD